MSHALSLEGVEAFADEFKQADGHSHHDHNEKSNSIGINFENAIFRTIIYIEISYVIGEFVTIAIDPHDS